VDRTPIEDGTWTKKVTREGQHIGGMNRSMMGDESEMIAFYLTDRRVIGIAKAGRALRDLVIYAAWISWRA
jgi:hypothetical protein